jgi:hypothetical protein
MSPPISTFHVAVVSGDLEAARELLEVERGPLAVSCDADGQSSLHLASLYGDCEMMALLLRHAPLHKFPPNRRGNTPLHCASLSGSSEAVRVLFGHMDTSGSQLNHANLWGETAAHLAAGAGHRAVIEVLRELGADLEARDSWGRTATEVFQENYAGAGKGELAAAPVAAARAATAAAVPRALSKRIEAPLDERLLAELLADPETDLTGKDMFGWAALHKLASWGHQRGLSAVLKEIERRRAGSILDALTQRGGPEGKTVLHCAVDSGWAAARLIKSMFSYLTREEAEQIKDAKDKAGAKASLPEGL